MKRSLLSFKAILMKDVVTEFRARQVLPTMIVLGILIIWIMRIVSEVSPIDTQTMNKIMGPAALWIAFLFSGLLAQERSFATEQQDDCIYALMLAPLDAGTIYLSKLVVNIIMLSVFEVVMVVVVMVAFKLTLVGSVGSLVGILLLGNIGISSVGTLFSAMVQLTRTRGSLLSIMVLVILLPMMIPATFALLVVFGAVPAELAGKGAISFMGTFRTAIGYLIAFDAVFVTASWLLFPVAIKE